MRSANPASGAQRGAISRYTGYCERISERVAVTAQTTGILPDNFNNDGIQER